MPYGHPISNMNSGAHYLLRCLECAALVPNDKLEKESHENYHEQQRSRTVSQVNWCDVGEHAYKANEPGSQSFQGTEYDANGDARQVRKDVCATHSFQPEKKAISPADSERA